MHCESLVHGGVVHEPELHEKPAAHCESLVHWLTQAESTHAYGEHVSLDEQVCGVQTWLTQRTVAPPAGEQSE